MHRKYTEEKFLKKFLISVLSLALIVIFFSSCDTLSKDDALPQKEQSEKPVELPTEHLHKFGEWTVQKEPTCDSEGSSHRVCRECNESEEISLAPVGHRFSKSIFAPTCSNEGYTLYECACGYSYSGSFVAPLKHDFKKTLIEATCTSEGYTEYACNCGYSYTGDFVAPLGHDFKKTVTDATCTTEGYTEYVCECTYSYIGDFVAPLGHKFEKNSVFPTATSGGYTLHSCDCGYSYKADHVFYSDIIESAYVQSSEVVAKGIDVSKWNHNIDSAGNYLPLDWELIKAAGIDFVILKVGSTKSGLEPTFNMDYEGARAAGLEIGAYFYTYSGDTDAIKKEALDVLEWLGGKQFEYPIYFDIEDPSLEHLGKNILSDMCEIFITTLQSEGYYAALYSNHNWLTYILDSAKMFTLFDIWYARYPLTDDPTWDEEKYGKQLGMWQYSDSGSIEGIDAVFDMNYAYRDYSEIMKKWGLNGY